MRRTVKHGVYESRENSLIKVTVTHSPVYLNKFGTKVVEEAVIFHLFNAREYVNQVMSVRDFRKVFKFAGKLLTVHTVIEKISA